jgi:hypothetical protein
MVGFLPFQFWQLPDFGIFAALCLSSQPATHPGVGLLLKTKAKPQFDRTVTDRSKLFLAHFPASNRVQFSFFNLSRYYIAIRWSSN